MDQIYLYLLEQGTSEDSPTSSLLCIHSTMEIISADYIDKLWYYFYPKCESDST